MCIRIGVNYSEIHYLMIKAAVKVLSIRTTCNCLHLDEPQNNIFLESHT